jgi:hypothetical protein
VREAADGERPHGGLADDVPAADGFVDATASLVEVSALGASMQGESDGEGPNRDAGGMARLIEGWRSSGRTAVTFAAEHGIS